MNGHTDTMACRRLQTIQPPLTVYELLKSRNVSTQHRSYIQYQRRKQTTSQLHKELPKFNFTLIPPSQPKRGKLSRKLQLSPIIPKDGRFNSLKADTEGWVSANTDDYFFN